MKHVCIVTSVHPLDDVRVASRIATAMLNDGYRVTWVGPDRTVPADNDVRISDINYRLFESGYTRSDRLRGASRAVRLAKRVKDVDWWYTPDPDVAGKLPGLARELGGRTMFDVHESYHGGLLERWFPGRPPKFVRNLLKMKIAAACRKIDLVVGVSSRVLEPYTAGHPNVTVVRNLAPAWFSTRAGRSSEPVRSGRLRILHGKLARGNGTNQVAEALHALPDDVQDRVSVLMLDVGSPLVEMVRTLPVGTVEVIPAVPHEQMVGLMSQCSVGLISYQRDLGYESLPNRLFEYMASGLAIVAPEYSPDIVQILEEEKIGITADFEAPDDIARAIAWCANNTEEIRAMGERARRVYSEKYTWDRESERMLNAMSELEV